MGYLDYAGLQYLWGKLKEKFAPKSHTHDDRYYTESEMDGKLGSKVDNTETGADGLLSKLTTSWTATPTDNTYFIRQDTGGGNSFGRVKFSTVWSYIKSKADSIYQPKGSYAASGHTHDDRYYTESEINTKLSGYLPTAGGTMGGTAKISWPDSGNWSNSNKNVTFPVKRGGLSWSGQSDGVELYGEETGNDNLDLVLKFTDDNSNSLRIVNASGATTARITATGAFTGKANTAGTADVANSVEWNNVKNKPSTYAPSSHTHDDRYYTETEINNKLAAKAESIVLASNANLNNITTPGIYSCGGGNSITNKPSGLDAIGLIVVHNATGGYYTQILTTSSNTNTYRRTCLNGTWSAWTQDKYTDTNTWRGIQNNLTSESTTDSLSAAQGKALKGLVDGKAASNHTHKSVIDNGNGSSATTFAYSKAGMNYGDYTWLAAWNGYELRAVNKSQFATAGHTHSYAGSSSAGGSATSAVKLDSSAGSTIQPVYFSGGKPVACTYTLGKSVPSDAKFTDTIYGVATASANGLMSSTDKAKMDDFSKVISIQKSIKLTTDWQDTGIAGTNLDSGTYVVQVSGFNSSYTTLYQEVYSGIMTWFSGGTNSGNASEIFLHNAGHADNNNAIYLRTLRQAGSNPLKLQIAAKAAASGTDTLTFKFRRLI